MNNPIIYNGEEYKDIFYASTPVKPSLRLRLAILFCHEFRFEHEVYTKQIMPAEKTIGKIHTRNLWDILKAWNYKRKGLHQMQAPNFDKP